ncbi:hypothetical protein [Bifidobacterium moukalabense]|uniref:Uncharacterized protein n=1 Tax=Bifidobacterium moukalabense DSM 27321 TaxID=1435051 RepID=W4N7B9_9BIFI|nr:hypothetical protein [Bifidobacterium moukalabense]ETY70983.1 hypothetical protein BMOU_1846 [Bifidobacterium moukalabense DSM 27321]
MNTRIITDVPDATPSLFDEHGRLPVQKSMLSNDGDGDAFDVRVFGHDCVVRAYAWEKRSDNKWKIGERTMVPRISNDGDDVKLAVWLPEDMDELPTDAAICVHWVKSPTRLRRCGYATIPVSELQDEWWKEKDWRARHRIAERIREWWAHRRFHRNPEDAAKAPIPNI